MTRFLNILPSSAARMYRGRKFRVPVTAGQARHEAELMEALTRCGVSGFEQTVKLGSASAGDSTTTMKNQ